MSGSGTVPPTAPRSISPWAWVPTLYLAEGLPNVIVAAVSVVLYKNLGVSNAEIAFYTSWLYLPWVLKPLWSPVVDIVRTRRLWIWTLQLVMGFVFAGVALALPTERFFFCTLVLFAVAAIVSATHDIAADGFYLLELSVERQALFVGVRNSFYRVAMICGQGGLVALAGRLSHTPSGPARGWTETFALVSALFFGFGFYHAGMLPRPKSDQPKTSSAGGSFSHDFIAAIATFFRKPGLGASLLFMLFYRFGEAQLV